MSRFSAQEEYESLSDGSKLAVLRMSGYIQLDTVKEMERCVMQCYEQGSKWLAMDFSNIKLLNSTGLGMLVKLRDTYEADERKIVLIGVDDKIGGLLDMLGISNLFEKFNAASDVKYFLEHGKLPPKPKKEPKKATPEFAKPKAKPKTERKAAATIKTESPAETINTKETKRVSKDNPYIETKRHDTKKRTRPKKNIPYGINIQYYSKMQKSTIHSMQMEIICQQPENLFLKEFFDVEVIPEFPGCIVTPPYQRVNLSMEEPVSLDFTVTPITTGKNDAKINFYSQESRENQSVKFSFTAFEKNDNYVGWISALIMFLTGFVVHGYQLADSSANWMAKILTLLGGTGLYLFLATACAMIGYSIYNGKDVNKKKDSCETSFSFNI